MSQIQRSARFAFQILRLFRILNRLEMRKSKMRDLRYIRKGGAAPAHGFLPIAIRARRWYRHDDPKRLWNISRTAARKLAQPSGPRR